MSLSNDALDALFRNARTANGFLEQAVSLDLLQQVYELARMPPTSMNTQPARYVFLRSAESRERLIPALMAGNVAKTRAAPVTVIVATDSRFFEHMPQVWHDPGAEKMFADNTDLARATAGRNGSLSGAYFMLAARALGLDCGPMSGFDAGRVNAEFFPDGRWQANFLLNLGHADPAKAHPRNPRLAFDVACRVL